MNLEAEFRDFLMNNLKTKFQILDTQNLLLYLHLRYECLTGQSSIRPTNFMKFIVKELYITDCSEGVFYQNQFMLYSFQLENSLSNIYEEWNFDLFQHLFLDMNGHMIDAAKHKDQIMKEVTVLAKRKVQKYNTSIYKDKILTYFKLITLNSVFHISLVDVPNLEHVEQINIRLTDEEMLERYLQAENFNTTNVKTITEASLRDYLFTHLNLLDKNLKPVGREIPVQEGRIDILAQDNNDNLVVIELKTKVDKRLVWQCLYYPDVVRTKYPFAQNIRVITVCPEYPDYLLSVLKKIPDLEMYQYQVIVTNHQIEQLNFVQVV